MIGSIYNSHSSPNLSRPTRHLIEPYSTGNGKVKGRGGNPDLFSSFGENTVEKWLADQKKRAPEKGAL